MNDIRKVAIVSDITFVRSLEGPIGKTGQASATNAGERIDISSLSASVDLSTARNKLYFSLTGDSAITANNKTLFKDFEIIFRHGALGPFTCSWNTVDLGLTAAADTYEYFTISLPATDYQAVVKYQIGDYVLSFGIFYKSLTADNTGSTPVEGASWTVEEPPFHIYGAGQVPLVIP